MRAWGFPVCSRLVFEKEPHPFYLGEIEEVRLDYIATIGGLHSARQLVIRTIEHSLANAFVEHHHYLHRKLYIARNVSYGAFADRFLVGVCMYGFPVWKEYPGLVPPLRPAQCPELLRLCTLAGLPKNTESRLVGVSLRKLVADWEKETGDKPEVVTSFCDTAIGFNGAIYKATNFKFFRETEGRPANPGMAHGKWGTNMDNSKAKKTMWCFYYNKNKSSSLGPRIVSGATGVDS